MSNDSTIEEKEKISNTEQLAGSEGREVSMKKELVKKDDSGAKDVMAQPQKIVSTLTAGSIAERPKKSHDEVFKEDIEDILEEDVEEFYKKMTTKDKKKFKREGEIAIGLIEALLHETKIRVKLIVTVLLKWLRLIPGVNKFFVEQTVRKKTAQLLRLKEEHDKEHINMV